MKCQKTRTNLHTSKYKESIKTKQVRNGTEKLITDICHYENSMKNYLISDPPTFKVENKLRIICKYLKV